MWPSPCPCRPSRRPAMRRRRPRPPRRAPWPGSSSGWTWPSSPPLPPGVAGGLVILGQRVPVGTGEAIEVVDDLAVAKRQLADELLGAPLAGPERVDEPEAAVLEPQHGHVGPGPDGQMAEAVLLDLARGVPRGPRDDVVERHAQREELAH